MQIALMATFFISHGSPTLSIDDSLPARHFLKAWQDKQSPYNKPKSILLISARWDTHVPTVANDDFSYASIHDFFGFPYQFYQLEYRAEPAPDLGLRVQDLLRASGFRDVEEVQKRGLDHAAWIPLMLMYPEPGIPVCTLSIQSNKDGTYHYEMGKALAPLKDEGVLIFGSGNVVYEPMAVQNLWTVKHRRDAVASWASDFDNWLKDALLEGRYEHVKRYDEKAPHADKAHSTPGHIFPLLVALGAAGENAKAELIHQSWQCGTISYASYKFTKAT